MAEPDVLFIVLDSLRRDRVSVYGHDRETTPAFDRLAARGNLYEDAYTPAPWTLPSHCSMFTGRFPSEHGITNGFPDRSLRLPDEFQTVTERLADSGYRTAGFSNNPWVGRLSGLDRGFDTYVEWDLEIGRGPDMPIHHGRDQTYSRAHAALGLAARQPLAIVKRRFFTKSLVERAKRWFDHGDSPTFTFMNLMEAHSPYYPPREAFRKLGLPTPGPIEARSLNTKLIPYTAGKTSLDGTTRERVLEFYDASARFQDRQLRSLLEHLVRLGRFEDMLVVVCADHGKTLGEFDRSATPPHYLRNVNTKVPLVIKRPGQGSGKRIERPVELTGLYDLFVDRDAETDLARRGVALIEDHIPHTGRSVESVTKWWAVADGNRKYLRSEAGDEFVLEGRGLDETVSHNGAGKLQSAMDERLGALAEPIETTDEPGSGFDRNVEGQLEDLGYL